MSKYNKGDKFIIEIADVQKSHKDSGEELELYRIKGFDSLVMTDYGLDRIYKLEEFKIDYNPIKTINLLRDEFGEEFIQYAPEEEYCLYYLNFNNEIEVGVTEYRNNPNLYIVNIKCYTDTEDVRSFMEVLKFTRIVKGEDALIEHLEKIKNYRNVEVGDEVEIKEDSKSDWKGKSIKYKFELLRDCTKDCKYSEDRYIILVRDKETNKAIYSENVYDVRKVQNEQD